jgi:hypothetical protein
MGKIELQLTFANVTDALYWFSPSPAYVTHLVVPSDETIPGNTPFLRPRGHTLIPIAYRYDTFRDYLGPNG